MTFKLWYTGNMNRLNIVNEKGEVIGEDSRENIHKQGLLHAEIHVWFYTPNGELVFQHRSKNKDTFPDLLDATVGGHVEIGDSLEETAVKEVEEETGVNIEDVDLVYIATTKTKSFDEVTEMTNYALRKVFAFRFEDDLNELRLEEGKSLGFELWPIDSLLDPDFEHKGRFIPRYFEEDSLGIFRKIKDLI